MNSNRQITQQTQYATVLAKLKKFGYSHNDLIELNQYSNDPTLLTHIIEKLSFECPHITIKHVVDISSWGNAEIKLQTLHQYYYQLIGFGYSQEDIVKMLGTHGGQLNIIALMNADNNDRLRILGFTIENIVTIVGQPGGAFNLKLVIDNEALITAVNQDYPLTDFVTEITDCFKTHDSNSKFQALLKHYRDLYYPTTIVSHANAIPLADSLQNQNELSAYLVQENCNTFTDEDKKRKHDNSTLSNVKKQRLTQSTLFHRETPTNKPVQLADKPPRVSYYNSTMTSYGVSERSADSTPFTVNRSGSVLPNVSYPLTGEEIIQLNDTPEQASKYILSSEEYIHLLNLFSGNAVVEKVRLTIKNSQEVEQLTELFIQLTLAGFSVHQIGNIASREPGVANLHVLVKCLPFLTQTVKLNTDEVYTLFNRNNSNAIALAVVTHYDALQHPMQYGKGNLLTIACRKGGEETIKILAKNAKNFKRLGFTKGQIKDIAGQNLGYKNLLLILKYEETIKFLKPLYVSESNLDLISKIVSMLYVKISIEETAAKFEAFIQETYQEALARIGHLSPSK